jgi:hypothetical protein
MATSVGRVGYALDVKGKRMQSVQDVNIHTPRLQKLKHSNFTFTFNTNHRPESKDEIIMLDEQINECVDQAFSMEKNIKGCLKVIDSVETDVATHKKHYVTHVMTQEEFNTKIKRIKVRHHNEVGTNYKMGGRFHIHGYMYILHTSMIHFDIDVIKDAINEKLRAKNLPIIHYAHMGFEKPSMKDYMQKQDVAI